ncbi:MAG: hypothetical protein FWG68_07250 [Defluviitaleaceae bacterium]|nr:hypothetical protein [Defluviitaleaceae bacterium]
MAKIKNAMSEVNRIFGELTTIDYPKETENGGMTDYQFHCFMQSIRRELRAAKREIEQKGTNSEILDEMLHDYEKYAKPPKMPAATPENEDGMTNQQFDSYKSLLVLTLNHVKQNIESQGVSDKDLNILINDLRHSIKN